jgi:protein tyrosine phosphatase (PTP) superfamily phosphohydrolase (DUF442 family)
MTVEQIYNYRRIDEHLSLGGQPSEDQLRTAAAAGFAAVVNLSTNDPRYALPDEEGLVRSLGLQYHYLPVQWDTPQLADFERYAALMDGLGATKTLVHCAANYRVSAFYALYAARTGRWTIDEARAFIASVWQPDDHPQWRELIDTIARDIAG